MIVEAGIGVNKSPQEQLIAADELNESLAAVFNALIGQLVSQGFKSLSDKGKSTNTWFDSANESVKSLLASLEAAVAKLQAIVSNREASISIIETINAKINALLAECSEYLNTNYPGAGIRLARERSRNEETLWLFSLTATLPSWPHTRTLLVRWAISFPLRKK